MKNFAKTVFASFLSLCMFAPIQSIAQQESTDNVSVESKICSRYAKFVLVAAEFKIQGVPISTVVDEINRQKESNPEDATLLREIAFETYKRIPRLSDVKRVNDLVADLANGVYIDCYTQLSKAVE